jgi:hypothetical protein
MIISFLIVGHKFELSVISGVEMLLVQHKFKRSWVLNVYLTVVKVRGSCDVILNVLPKYLIIFLVVESWC